MGQLQLKEVPEDVDKSYYIKTSGQSFNQFMRECKEVERDYEKFDSLLDKYTNLSGVHRSMFADVFTHYISHGVPELETISLIKATFDKHLTLYPDARLIDLGTGSGVFPWLLHRSGIPKDKIIAVDLPLEQRTQRCPNSFWDNIIEDENYICDKNDMVLVVWGFGRYYALDRYLLNGGSCVVILGEDSDGCTFPANFFTVKNHSEVYAEVLPAGMESIPGLEPDYVRRGKAPSAELKNIMKGWNTETYHVMGAKKMSSPDYLTINTRERKDEI